MILAPTLSLSAGSGAAIVRPTFSRDFAGEKTLNNGTGPAITFTRGSQATYFTADGTLRFAPHNAIRNSQAVGSTNGVIGSGGVAPTNWSVSGSGLNGITVEISTGTEDGLAYVDFRLSGTATASSVVGINTELGTHVVAESGQTWTASGYVKLAGGSLSGVSACLLFTTGRTSAGSAISGQYATTTFTPTSSTLSAQRIVGTRTFTDATVARVTGNWEVAYTSGAAINFTLRIAAPQLERNATPSDYIPTTGTANFDQPRFDHSGGSSLGLLIEEARTNSIRNSQAGGSTAGVIGSGGAMPTNGWSISANANNVTSEVLGTGTEDGLDYIDIKISGTPSGNGSVFIQFLGSNTQAALNGQTWTLSAYRRLIAGTVTNELIFVNVSGRNAAAAAIAGQTQSTTAAPTGAALKTQRTSATFTFSDATVAFVLPRAGFQYFSGSQIGGSANGITLRIAAPQLEQGAFPTSYIPTTSAAVTRSADSAVVTPISSFYNASEGTLFAEASPRSATEQPNVPRIVVNLNSNSGSEQITIAQDGANDAMLFVAYILAGGGSAAMTGGSSITTTTQRVCAAYKQSDFAASFNGGAVDAETSGNVPSGITHMHIGMRPDAGTGALSGHIRKVAYYPKRLSNALLQSLTA